VPSFAPAIADSAVLLIDVQERFLPAIPGIAPDQACGRACRVLLEGANLLRVPVTISEQYPAGLGPTLPHLLAAAPAARRLAKTHFSCVDDPSFADHLARDGRRHVVVAGIEAHVCVLATVADLLAGGFAVIVADDAVASRSPAHRSTALAAMRDLGALVAPVESILFRLQRQAGTGCFKALSALVR
jgi:nicotinamidase-related amidase